MKQRLMSPPSLMSVLLEIVDLSDESFAILLTEVRSPDAFDAERERVNKISKSAGIDSETAGYILNGLAYLYKKIHEKDIQQNEISNVIEGLIDIIEEEEEIPTEERPNLEVKKIITQRLSRLLERQFNASNFAKHERLRAGFLPVALGFSSFIDLRPNLSDDLTKIEELIPLIQFRVRTDSNVGLHRNFIFQMDARGLKRLREAVDRAERKLSNVQSNESFQNLITKRIY